SASAAALVGGSGAFDPGRRSPAGVTWTPMSPTFRPVMLRPESFVAGPAGGTTTTAVLRTAPIVSGPAEKPLTSEADAARSVPSSARRASEEATTAAVLPV